MTKELYTLQQTANYLQVDELTIHVFIRKEINPLPAFKVGAQWRFYKDKIDNWVKDNGNIKPERAGD